MKTFTLVQKPKEQTSLKMKNLSIISHFYHIQTYSIIQQLPLVELGPVAYKLSNRIFG